MKAAQSSLAEATSLAFAKRNCSCHCCHVCLAGPSVAGIIAYRGAQFGLNDTIMAFNPYAKESGPIAIASKFVVAQIAVEGVVLVVAINATLVWP